MTNLEVAMMFLNEGMRLLLLTIGALMIWVALVSGWVPWIVGCLATFAWIFTWVHLFERGNPKQVSNAPT